MKFGLWLALILVILQVSSTCQAQESDEVPAVPEEVPAAVPEEPPKEIIRAKLISTTSCQLDFYPHVQKFIFEKGGALSYENVQHIEGFGVPTIVWLVSPEKAEKIDLLEIETYEELHELFRNHGLKQKTEEEIEETELPPGCGVGEPVEETFDSSEQNAEL
jgi:Sep15/SelM redox domain